jgi:L-alanine-DL-glutamate epimerase-like enolase superfamily enzyme
VYGWIGGDRPSDVLEQAKERKEQGFTAVKMNAVESVNTFYEFLLSFDNFPTSSDY